jgi:hypothetical protein
MASSRSKALWDGLWPE